MKNYKMFKLLLLSFVQNYVLLGSVTIIEPDSKYNNPTYRKFFSISKDAMKLKPNGGEMKSIQIAIDDEKNESGWISVGSQGDEYTNPDKVKYDSLTNHIIVTFDKTSLIDRMIYRAVYILNTCSMIGYPKELKVYYRMKNEKGEFSEDEDDFILADDIISEATNKTVLFTFSEAIECDQLKIEWNQTNYCNTYYKRRASADELKFLIPETENINETIVNAFSDYNRLTLSKKFNNKNVIRQLKEELKTLEFSEYPKNYIERMEDILDGILFYNPKREFTTNPKESRANIIYQRGNIYNYARNELLLSRAGLNRQITGIYGRTNESITVYVEAEEGTPLPCLQFSQFAGERVFWKGKEQCLKLGEQILKVDDFNISNYKYKVNPGGPIYILNTYTPEEQSQKVKIYIDGGILFPVFKINGDEEKYREDLLDYIQLYRENKKDYLDVTELVSDKIMITVKASDAYRIYSEEEKGPQANLLSWDKYLGKIYQFYGIELRENSPDYNIKNNYINIQLRFNQPLTPYAVTEYIGIHDDEWVDKSLYIVGQETDWDFTCQIADMLDIRESFIFEILNKLAAKYSQEVIKEEKNKKDNNLYQQKIKELTLDNIENNMRGCADTVSSKCKGFLQNKRNNYLVFWDLESYSHGFWAKMENLYRKEYKATSGLTNTERMVYFASLAMGIDLGYYFTRWGFYLEGLRDNIFNEEKASKNYKNLMEQELLEGRLEKDQKKFWYLDNEEYNYMDDIGMKCYEDKEEYDIQIEEVSGSNGDYTITMPKVKCPGHLGYEIYENNTLIAFTYDNEYTDETIYEDDYVPKYNIIAYDRYLITSEPSKVKSP